MADAITQIYTQARIFQRGVAVTRRTTQLRQQILPTVTELKKTRRDLALAWASLQISLGKGWAPQQDPDSAVVLVKKSD